MNFDIPKQPEKLSENKERLLALEKEGNCVFHGSVEILDVLEPRQAYNKNNETGIMEKDGDPSVFATPYVDVAIFRALTNINVQGESESEFGFNNGTLHFKATENILEAAKKVVGKIYVLDGQKFNKTEGMQCRSSERVNPIEVIDVTFGDLPKNIERIINNQEKHETH